MQKRNSKGVFVKTGLYKKCLICKKRFYVKWCWRNKAKFCSKECYYKYRKGLKPSKETLRKRSLSLKGRKVSEETKQKMSIAAIGNKNGIGNFGKKRLDITGSKHYNWKGGVGRHKRSNLSSLPKYKHWRKAVLERDKYTCQKCGLKHKVVVHHIKEWIKYPKLRYDINNGLTVCVDCHKDIHSS